MALYAAYHRCMTELLDILRPADYRFLAGLIESPFNLTPDATIHRLVEAVEREDSPENRRALNEQLESTIRYLGSSDLMFAARFMTGGDPGAPFSGIVRTVANSLNVDPPPLGTDREMVEKVATDYATKTFSELSPDEQQKMLEDLGVEREKAVAFLKRSAGVFALPMLIEAFNIVIVQGLIKTIIFGTIAKIIGRQLAGRLFSFLAGRLPWWVSWVGPAAWTLSIGWTALDIQGPAKRKTIPIVLYLGVCSLRERTHEDGQAGTTGGAGDDNGATS